MSQSKIRISPTILPAFAAAMLAGAGLVYFQPDAGVSAPSGPNDDQPYAYTGDFIVVDDLVVPDSRYVARFQVLGSQLTSGGSYDMPVTLGIKIEGDIVEPFGSFNEVLAGNVNDGENPREWIVPDRKPANTWFAIEAQSWEMLDEAGNANDPGNYTPHMTMLSDTDSPYVLALRNGDAVPSIPPYMNQRDISDIIREYIDPTDNTIELFDDEVIYLFELGVTDLNSPAADFQDLVVLVTLADDPKHFEDPEPRIRPTVVFD